MYTGNSNAAEKKLQRILRVTESQLKLSSLDPVLDQIKAAPVLSPATLPPTQHLLRI